MANEHPSVTVQSVSRSAGGLVSGSDSIAVISCAKQGRTTPLPFQGAAALVAEYANGDGVEFSARYLKRVKKPIWKVRVPVTTAGSIAQLRQTGSGTSVVSTTGTPEKTFEALVRVENDGTIGTDGIKLRVAIGGRSDEVATAPLNRLGTSTTFALANTGITLSFAAGTLKAGDEIYVAAHGPRASNADISAAVAALTALPQKFRAILVCGDFTEAQASALLDDIATARAAGKRSVFFLSVRDRYRDAVMTGKPSDVDFAAVGHTITRNTGSWVTDGFKVGQTVSVSGSASNDGAVGVLTAVSATVLTFGSGVIAESNVDGATISVTATESDSVWAAAMLSDFASYADTNGHTAISSGCGWGTSEIHKTRMRMPAAWHALTRYMQHDLQVGPDRREDGALEDCSIEDENRVITEHDSRTNQVLESFGFLTLCSDVDEPGCFVGYPSTMAAAGSAFGVIPWRAVTNLFEDVVAKVTNRFLGGNPATNKDGTLTDHERQTFSKLVTRQLEAELLTPKTEGARASSVSWEAAADDVVNVPNAILHGEGSLGTLGRINQVSTTVYVNG